MSQFLVDYGLFLAKTLTVVAAAVVIIVATAAASRKGRDAGGLVVKNLNERFREIGDSLRKELLSKDEYKAVHGWLTEQIVRLDNAEADNIKRYSRKLAALRATYGLL